MEIMKSAQLYTDDASGGYGGGDGCSFDCAHCVQAQLSTSFAGGDNNACASNVSSNNRCKRCFIDLT